MECPRQLTSFGGSYKRSNQRYNVIHYMNKVIEDFKAVAKELHTQLGDRSHAVKEWDDGFLLSVHCPFSSKESWDVEEKSDEKGEFCSCCGQNLQSLYDGLDAKAEYEEELRGEQQMEHARGN